MRQPVPTPQASGGARLRRGSWRSRPMFQGRIWAIDLGRSAVKGVLLASVRDGVEILDAGIVPLVGPPPEDVREPSRDPRLWEALSEFQRRHDIRRHRIALAIPAQNALVREIKVALVGRRSVEELVRFEASNAIPFVLDEVVWDYELFENPEDRTTQEGAIFAVKKTTVQTYLHALAQIGAEGVVEVTIAPLAALSFLRLEMGPEGPVLLLDIGAENTGLILTDGARFWIRNLLRGGNHVTTLLARKFDIPFEQAQKAKHNIPRSEMAAELVSAVKPALHEMVAELQSNLQYCLRTGGICEPQKVYAVGGGARLTGLKAQLRQSLGREVSDVRSVEHVFVSSEANTQMVRANLDRLAVAIGAGAKALQKVPLRASLVPESMARMTRAAGLKRLLAVAGVLAWAIMLAWFFFARQCAEHLEGAIAHSREVNLHYARNLRRLETAQDTSLATAELAYLQSVGVGRAQPSALLAEVVAAFQRANRGPVRFVLSSFRCERAGAPSESAGPPELDVLIAGRVVIPPGEDQSRAYEYLKGRVVDALCGSPLFARSMGRAHFSEGSRRVKGSGMHWKRLVAPGDRIVAVKDGVWYKVAEVLSDNELSLTQPFAGGNLDSEFMVSRVEVVQFDTEPGQARSFRLRARVPARLADLGKPARARPRKAGRAAGTKP